MSYSRLGPKLMMFAVHMAGTAFGVASVAWALRFHSLLAAVPWGISAVVGLPMLAGVLFRRFLTSYGAVGQRRIVLASALGYFGGAVLMSVVTGVL
jgi:hypothetical protein